MAEETVHPLDDQRAEMLKQWPVRALDQQGQDTARLAAGGKADRFGRGDLGVALADDLAPAADDRALHEAEAPEGHSADFAHELAGRARTAAARRILGLLLCFEGDLGFAIAGWSCHRACVAANRLLQHYVDNARRLPWRAMPGEPAPDPYRVWLSEVMLQQTTVAAVTPRFERFLSRWPTVEALAAARDEDVLSEWAGLGYYARARNLIACAREVAARGGFPTTEDELRKLPGIGGYTAAAIAAIAFGQRALGDGHQRRAGSRAAERARSARGREQGGVCASFSTG